MWYLSNSSKIFVSLVATCSVWRKCRCRSCKAQSGTWRSSRRVPGADGSLRHSTLRMAVMSNWQRRFWCLKTNDECATATSASDVTQNDQICQGPCHESFKRISTAIQDEELGHSIQNSSDTGILSVALGRTLQYWRDSIDIQQAKEATCLRTYQEFRVWHLEIGIAAFLQVSGLRSLLIKTSFEVGHDRLLSTTCRARPIHRHFAPERKCQMCLFQDSVFINLRHTLSVGLLFYPSTLECKAVVSWSDACCSLRIVSDRWLPCLQTAVDTSKDSRSMHLPIWYMCFAESCCSSRTMPLWSYLSCPLSHFI